MRKLSTIHSLKERLPRCNCRQVIEEHACSPFTVIEPKNINDDIIFFFQWMIVISAILMPFAWKEHADVELGIKAMGSSVQRVRKHVCQSNTLTLLLLLS